MIDRDKIHIRLTHRSVRLVRSVCICIAEPGWGLAEATCQYEEIRQRPQMRTEGVMNDTMALSAEAVLQQRDAFIERLLQDAAGAFSIFALYLGDRLGFYRGLTETGSSTAGELAARTNTHEHYVREWLEQQAVTGIVEVEDESQPAEARRFRLPAGHVEPLIHCDSLNYLAPLAQLIAGAVHPLPKLVAAYRDGGGVPYSAYGVDLREGQSAINYSMYMSQLAQEWLPAMPDVHARLLTDPPARIADIGCGYGWSSIGMAKRLPKSTRRWIRPGCALNRAGAGKRATQRCVRTCALPDARCRRP
jgi:hypothetical protein